MIKLLKSNKKTVLVSEFYSTSVSTHFEETRESWY